MPFLNALGKYSNASSNAFSANASEASEAFLDTYASKACVITSKPVSAVIPGGAVITKDGSRIAISGKSCSSTRGYFTPFCASVITANCVTSEPVPLVVGIAIKRTGFPGFTLFAINTTDFAASIEDPPPNAITTSAFAFLKNSRPSVTSSIGGSGFTLSKILMLLQFPSFSAIRSAAPEDAIKESVKITAFFPLISVKASIAFSLKHTSVFILNRFI